MEAGKKRKRLDIASGHMTKDEALDVLEKYIEATFYECSVSAQYTANIQVLFKLEDIVQRMATSDSDFAKGLVAAKKAGQALLETKVEQWATLQSANIKTFFSANNLQRTTLLLPQRNSVTCTIDGQPIRFVPEPSEVSDVVSAINLLRYPMIVMEKLQRLRAGTLLDLEIDAQALIALASSFSLEAKSLARDLATLLKDKDSA